MTTVLTRSTTLTWDLLGLTPDLRNAFWAELSEDHRNGLLACFARDVGTPYGMWADDPVGFFDNILGVFTWSIPKTIARSVEENKRTVVPASHGVSKTNTAGRLCVWFGAVHPPMDTQIVTTAPRSRQVRSLLWPEIRRAHSRAKYPMPGKTDMTQWKVGDDYLLAYGFSAANASEDAVQGIHANHLLIVIDEAGGIPHKLGQGIESITTGAHTRVLAIGNPPTEEEGTWFEERTKSELWHTIRIAWEDSPNYTGEEVPDEVKAALVDEEWVKDQVTEFGWDSTFVHARVKALFPSGATNKVIGWSWIEEAQENDQPDPSTWVRLGVDPAADGGDELAIALAVGNVVSIVHTSSGAQNAQPNDVAGKVLEQIRHAEEIRQALGEVRPVRVKIDSIGIGWGVAGILRAWGAEGIHHAQIIDCNVSESANDDDKFVNKRSEMWWNGREMIRTRPADTAMGTPARGAVVKLDLEGQKRAASQLNAPTYGHDSRGRVQVEKKVDIKKRLMGSPDRAESILLALYEPEVSEPARSNAGLIAGN